jgi:hypothetical protein
VANERIAELMKDEELAADPAKAAKADDIRAFHLGLLQRDDSPSVPWVVIALAGFLAWVGGGFWLARRGVTAEDKLERRTAARAGLLIVIGLAVWMIGLYQA